MKWSKIVSFCLSGTENTCQNVGHDESKLRPWWSTLFQIFSPFFTSTTKIMESVCIHVGLCPAVRFVMLWSTELKLGMGIGGRPSRFESIVSKRSHQRSKDIQRSSCLTNALCLATKFGQKNASQAHRGSKVMQRSSGVNHRSNCVGVP